MKMVRIIGKDRQEKEVDADQVEDLRCSGWIDEPEKAEAPKEKGK